MEGDDIPDEVHVEAWTSSPATFAEFLRRYNAERGYIQLLYESEEINKDTKLILTYSLDETQDTFDTNECRRRLGLTENSTTITKASIPKGCVLYFEPTSGDRHIPSDSRMILAVSTKKRQPTQTDIQTWEELRNHNSPSILTMERNNKHLLLLAARKGHRTAFRSLLEEIIEQDVAETISDLNERGYDLATSVLRGGSSLIHLILMISPMKHLLSSPNGPHCEIDFPDDAADRHYHLDIFEASLHNDLTRLRTLLAAKSQHVKREDPPPLHIRMGSLFIATKKGFLQAAEVILSTLGDMQALACHWILDETSLSDTMALRHDSPLTLACRTRRLDMLKLFCQLGLTDLSMSTKLHSPCSIAVDAMDTEMLEIILNSNDVYGYERDEKSIHLRTKQLCINVVYRKSMTSLMVAASSTHENAHTIVKMLLNHRADMEMSDFNGNTALHLACKTGREDVVQLLIDRGACIDEFTYRVQHGPDKFMIYDTVGPTALQLASHRPGVVEILKKAGARMEDRSDCTEECARDGSMDRDNAFLPTGLPREPTTIDTNMDEGPLWCTDVVVHCILTSSHWSEVLICSQISRRWRRIATSNAVWSHILYSISSTYSSESIRFEYDPKSRIVEGFYWRLCQLLFSDLLRAPKAMSLLRPLDLQCTSSQWRQQMRWGKIVQNAQRFHCYQVIQTDPRLKGKHVFVCKRKKDYLDILYESEEHSEQVAVTCTAIIVGPDQCVTLTNSDRWITCNDEDGIQEIDSETISIDMNLKSGGVSVRYGGKSPLSISNGERCVRRSADQIASSIASEEDLQTNRSWSEEKKRDAIRVIERIQFVDKRCVSTRSLMTKISLERKVKFTLLHRDNTVRPWTFRYHSHLIVDDALSDLDQGCAIVNQADCVVGFNYHKRITQELVSPHLHRNDIKWLLLRIFKCHRLTRIDAWKSCEMQDDHDRVLNQQQAYNDRSIYKYTWRRHRELEDMDRALKLLDSHLTKLDWHRSFTSEENKDERIEMEDEEKGGEESDDSEYYEESDFSDDDEIQMKEEKVEVGEKGQ
ncbi:putative cortactin-binding protein [Planoprotostelium fungivorum]|uniref:Putative cortactin-binding protein n=1 Tax=Planoprotostelium fungivorum TaxID=1890364 RepID=A0A2P6NDB7_9EUKA|nr:putative cortactin-binding protein [Planoprotostelium fungivorum]